MEGLLAPSDSGLFQLPADVHGLLVQSLCRPIDDVEAIDQPVDTKSPVLAEAGPWRADRWTAYRLKGSVIMRDSRSELSKDVSYSG